MLKVLCNDSTREVQVCGFESDWKGFLETLNSNAESIVCLEEGDPSPYSRFAAMIRFAERDGNGLLLDLDESGLLFAFGNGTRAKLVDTIESFVAEYEVGEHFHFDPLDTGYLDGSSAFVVFAKLSSSDRG